VLAEVWCDGWGMMWRLRYDVMAEVWCVGWGMMWRLRYDVLAEVWCVGWGMMCWLRYDVLAEVWCVGWGMMCWLRYDVMAEVWCVGEVWWYQCAVDLVCQDSKADKCDSRNSWNTTYVHVIQLKTKLPGAMWHFQVLKWVGSKPNHYTTKPPYPTCNENIALCTLDGKKTPTHSWSFNSIIQECGRFPVLFTDNVILTSLEIWHTKLLDNQ